MSNTSGLPTEPVGATRVVVVAEVRLYREGLATNLGTRPNITVLGKAGGADEALALAAAMRPDVVVIDMGTRDALDLVRAIKRQDAHVRIVAFGVDESARDILACAEAGAAGYLPRDGSMDDLVTTIGNCRRGELVCSPRIAATLFERLSSLASGGRERAPRAVLTERERQILRLIDGGLCNKEIAQRLSIEVSTVKNHVHNILEKLKVTTRSQAAACLRTRPAESCDLDPLLSLF